MEKGSDPNSAKHPSGRWRLLGSDPFSTIEHLRDSAEGNPELNPGEEIYANEIGQLVPKMTPKARV